MTIPTTESAPFVTPGPLQIWTNTGVANAFEFLGWTRGGARINQRSYSVEAKSDLSGGEPGPPDDIQHLGEAHDIELEMARYVEAVMAKLEIRFNTGATRSKGALVIASGGAFKVILIANNFVRKYTNVLVPEPIERSPVGTLVQYPRLVLFGLEDLNNVVSSGNGVPYAAAPYTTNVTVTSSSVA